MLRILHTAYHNASYTLIHKTCLFNELIAPPYSCWVLYNYVSLVYKKSSQFGLAKTELYNRGTDDNGTTWMICGERTRDVRERNE